MLNQVQHDGLMLCHAIFQIVGMADIIMSICTAQHIRPEHHDGELSGFSSFDKLRTNGRGDAYFAGRF